MEVSGIVLAGGQSRRLGLNKAFVKVGGVPLIERVINRLSQVSDDVLIVTNDPESYRELAVQAVADTWPGKGALGAIHTGLEAARHERALVVGCDMPFLNLLLIRCLILLSADYDVVMPRLDGLLEPLHAIYSRATRGPIEETLRAGGLRIADFLSRVRVRYVERPEIEVFDPQHLSFFNVNIPEDLERAQKLAARDQGRAEPR